MHPHAYSKSVNKTSMTLSIIKRLLRKNRITQKTLTDYLGISKNAFTNWSNGSNSSYIKHLPQIAEFFNVSVDYLLDRDPQSVSSPVIYSVNDKIDSIIEILLSANIDDNDLEIINTVLNKYKK